MILHVLKAKAMGACRLRLKFSNGIEKTVDVAPLLRGPVFKPLLAPAYFARVSIDPVAGTVVWPNGADFAPEALLQLPALHRASRRKRAA